MAAEFFEIVERTDTGLARRQNEDAVAIHHPLGLVLVADGMGGAAAGEVASQMAVESVFHHLVHHVEEGVERDAAREEGMLGDALRAANWTLIEASRRHPAYSGMGTTLVAGLLRPRRLSYAHVGDSRLYRMRDGRLERVTRDHSLIQKVLDDGIFGSMEEARNAGVSENVLTRALGTDASVEVETGSIDIQQGDICLFCSDGLYNMLDEGRLQREIDQGRDDLEELADRLLELACFNGGSDNVTFVLVRRLHWDQ